MQQIGAERHWTVGLDAAIVKAAARPIYERLLELIGSLIDFFLRRRI
jgi:hypothetical protein